jgi:MobC-like protein
MFKELSMENQKGKKTNRQKWLNIRLNEQEFKKIHDGFSNSTKRRRSEYVRSILLSKPIFVYTRNKSIDDFLNEMILLRQELNHIGNNFNQLVKRLHMMEEKWEVKSWVILNQKMQELLLKKIDEIENKIIQIDSKWSQE